MAVSRSILKGLKGLDLWLHETVPRLASREERELHRLNSLPRFQETTTSLLGATLHVVDGWTFRNQYRAIFLHEIYRFPARRPDPRILDGGANVGLATLYWKRLYPAARIVAFEPDPRLFAALKWNCAQSAHGEVELVQKALWTSDGEVSFWSEGAEGGRLQALPPSGLQVPVQTVSLRQYLDEPVDLLKLDIEGAEVDVLLDCAERLDVVERIFVEYHSFAASPQRLPELLTVLRSSGLRLYLVPEIVGATIHGARREPRNGSPARHLRRQDPRPIRQARLNARAAEEPRTDP